MVWTKEWTIESVEGNYEAIGCIDPEDVFQLIEDAKELRRIIRAQKINELQARVEESEAQLAEANKEISDYNWQGVK